jgi:hypothetical protein
MGDEASDEGRCVLRRVEHRGTGRAHGPRLGVRESSVSGARCIAQMAADVVIAISILNAG